AKSATSNVAQHEPGSSRFLNIFNGLMVRPLYCVESVRDRNAAAFSSAPPREPDDANDNPDSGGSHRRIGCTGCFWAREWRPLGSHLGDIGTDLPWTRRASPPDGAAD